MSPNLSSRTFSARASLTFLICLLLSTAAAASSATSCQELKLLLEGKEGPDLIRVPGQLHCDRQTWGSTVNVTRNIVVRGTGGDGSDVSGIVWSDARKAIVVRDGSYLTFWQLALLQDDMGINGIDLGFLGVEGSSTGTFSEVVVGVVSCPGPVAATEVVVRGIDRPSWQQPGEQEISVVGEDLLLAEDVWVELKPAMANWRFCNVTFHCGASSMRDLAEWEGTGGNGVCGKGGLWHGDLNLGEGGSEKRWPIWVGVWGSVGGVAIVAGVVMGVVGLKRAAARGWKRRAEGRS